MTDTTTLIQRLRLMSPDLIGGEAADALEQQAADAHIDKKNLDCLYRTIDELTAEAEQQAAQIEALRADAERTRELLADANETLHGNYTVLMRLILTNPPGGRWSFFSARDGSMIEATGPINQTMTVIAALDAALRQEQPKPLVEIGRRTTPCGECHLQPGERCDICGARDVSEQPAGEGEK